jgi:hypothetical protein
VYSVFLGTVTPLNVSFNTTYYLGVKVGSGSELTPRFRLASAPYALSLIGQNNQFPSTGSVTADQVKASSGIPTDPTPHGYTFSNGGDEDGGLFSMSDGEVTLFVNGAKRIEMVSNPSNETIIHGPLSTEGQTVSGDINLINNGSISYNGLSDWRMVYQSDLSSSVDGWAAYAGGFPLGVGAPSNDIVTISSTSPFISNILRVTSNGSRLIKRQFDLTNIPHSEVKVTFNYFFLGSWDGSDYGIGGFADASNGTLNTAFVSRPPSNVSNVLNVRSLTSLTTGSFNDYYRHAEMLAEHSGNTIWVVFGGNTGGNNSEFWGVGNIKVWVR